MSTDDTLAKASVELRRSLEAVRRGSCPPACPTNTKPPPLDAEDASVPSPSRSRAARMLQKTIPKLFASESRSGTPHGGDTAQPSGRTDIHGRGMDTDAFGHVEGLWAHHFVVDAFKVADDIGYGRQLSHSLSDEVSAFEFDEAPQPHYHGLHTQMGDRDERAVPRRQQRARKRRPDRLQTNQFVWNSSASVETWAAIRAGVDMSVVAPTALRCLAEYGKRWDMDLFILPHNALRAEVVDMISILEGMARAGLNLTLEQIQMFSSWWTVFEAFLAAYFALEDAVLLPWAYQATTPREQDINVGSQHRGSGRALDRQSAQDTFGSISSLLDSTADESSLPTLLSSPRPSRFAQAVSTDLHADVADAMETRRTRIEHLATEVSNTFALFECRPSGEVLPFLYRSLQHFIPRLLSYLLKQEQQMARLLDPSRPDKLAMERGTLACMISGQNGLTNVVLLTRWALPGSAAVHALLRLHMKSTLRLRLQAQARRIEASHLRIPDYFRVLCDEPKVLDLL